MQIFTVKKLGGLDNRTPEDNVDPSNAVVCQYFDPFRSGPGTMRSALGFKANTPTGYEGDVDHDDYYQRVVNAFMLGGYKMIVTANRHAIGTIYSGARLWYVDSTDVFQSVNSDPIPGQYANSLFCVPSRILIDPHTYYAGDPTGEYWEIFYTYLWGDGGVGEEGSLPTKVSLVKKYSEGLGGPFTLGWMIRPANPTGHFIDSGGPGSMINMYFEGGQPPPYNYWPEDVTYYFFLEDIAGNFIYNKVNPAYRRTVHIGASGNGRMNIQIDIPQKWLIAKVHIYRYDDLADSEGQDDTFFGASLLYKVIELYQYGEHYRPHVWYQSSDHDGSELGLNPPIGRQMLHVNCDNAKKAYKSIGYHNNALWISKDNEVLFSDYTLDAPYGSRMLNFPTVNRWKFEGIGDIVDMVSLEKKLYVFGTRGISTLMGNFLDNFYEQKVSSVGVDQPRTGYGETMRTVETIDDKIFFIDNAGQPCVVYNGTVSVNSGLLIPKIGDVGSYYNPHDFPRVDYRLASLVACRYRNGYICSNGTTTYLFNPESSQWAEWPFGIRLFFQGADPYCIAKDISPVHLAEYDYLAYIDTSGNIKTYATDGTYADAVWKTPRLMFDSDMRFNVLLFRWRYNSHLNYEELDIDTLRGVPTYRTAEAPTARVEIYLDDKLDTVKSINANFLKIAAGEYVFPIRINCRGRRLAFKLTLTASKYFEFTGWELTSESLGRKSYE